MTKDIQELLKPRYKVIAEWPGVAGKVRIGDVRVLDDEAGVFWFGGDPFQEDKLKDYPHLFKKLEWHEERKPEEMPEYVKNNFGIYKVEQWLINSTHKAWAIIGSGLSDYAKELTPATKEEYDLFTSQKQKQ